MRARFLDVPATEPAPAPERVWEMPAVALAG